MIPSGHGCSRTRSGFLAAAVTGAHRCRRHVRPTASSGSLRVAADITTQSRTTSTARGRDPLDHAAMGCSLRIEEAPPLADLPTGRERIDAAWLAHLDRRDAVALREPLV